MDHSILARVAGLLAVHCSGSGPLFPPVRANLGPPVLDPALGVPLPHGGSHHPPPGPCPQWIRLPGSPWQGWAGSGQGCACRRPTLHNCPWRCLGSPSTLPGPAAPWHTAPQKPGARENTKGGPKQCRLPAWGCRWPWGAMGGPTADLVTHGAGRKAPRGTSLAAQPLFPAQPGTRQPLGNSSASKVLRQPPLLRGAPGPFIFPL